jgi:hypothetical protein
MNILARVLRWARVTREWAAHNIEMHAADIDWITPEGARLEAELAAAYAALPRRMAATVERHVLRRMDYYRLTGQEDGAA